MASKLAIPTNMRSHILAFADEDHRHDIMHMALGR